MLRHGESECNVKRMLYGRTDCGLTARGCEQARAAGRTLAAEPIERCVASPLIRASETARLALQGRDIEIELADGLMEQDMGDWENVPFEGVAAERPEIIGDMLQDWTRVVPPGGESYAEVRKRVAGVLDEVREKGRNTLLVAHAGPLSTALALLLELPDSAVRHFWFEQGTRTAVELAGGKSHLLYFNK